MAISPPESNDFLTNVRNRIFGSFEQIQSLPRSKQAILAGALIFFIVLVILILKSTGVFSGSSNKVLYRGLSDADGGLVVDELQKLGIPYSLSAGGTVSVPQESVYEARLQLAKQGLPKASGVGFELLDNQKFGISQFAEQVNYQRAVEGEIARTIESMGSIQVARVHIAYPKQSAFMKEQVPITASVLLTLLPGYVLDSSQIAAIVHFVATSVPGLSVKNVTIVDQEGSLLSKAFDQNGASLDAQQLNYVNQLESTYIKRVEGILEPIFGVGNVRAQVTIQMDYSETEQTSETFRPNSHPNPSATRSQHVFESTEPPKTPPNGVPGALSNQPPDAASAPLTLPPGVAPGTVTLYGQPISADTKNQMKREITTNYEVDKTISHSKLQKGVIKRVSAAVVVNHKWQMDTKTGSSKPTPLTEKELNEVTGLVREAVGYSADRGDSVNVVNTTFIESKGPETTEEKIISYIQENSTNLFKYGLLLIAILYLIFGVVRPIVRDIAKEKRMGVEGLDAVLGLDPDAIKATQQELDAETAEAIEERERSTHYETILKQARKLAEENPSMIANALKRWVVENKGDGDE